MVTLNSLYLKNDSRIKSHKIGLNPLPSLSLAHLLLHFSNIFQPLTDIEVYLKVKKKFFQPF